MSLQLPEERLLEVHILPDTEHARHTGVVIRSRNEHLPGHCGGCQPHPQYGQGSILCNIYIYIYLSYILQLNNGKFFSTLILSTATSAFFTDMLRISELFWAWGSPQLAQLNRNYEAQPLNLNEPGIEFPYGYLYALQITILYIVMTFSTNVMAIHISGSLYFLLRLYLDSFTMHWLYNRTQMNSQSQLAQKTILSAGLSVLPLQIIILSIFLMQQENLYILLTLMLIAFTIIVNVKTSMKKDQYIFQLHDYITIQVNNPVDHETLIVVFKAEHILLRFTAMEKQLQITHQ